MGECQCCSRKGEVNLNEMENNENEQIISNSINKKGTIQNNNYFTNINLNYINSQQKNGISNLLNNNYNMSYTQNNIKNQPFDLFSSSHSFNNKENKQLSSKGQKINYINPNEKSSLLESLRNLMLKEINNSRKNPLSVIPKIEKYYQYIDVSNKNEFFIKVDEKNKIRLYKGKNVFIQCQNFLKKLSSLPSFILKNEMTFPFPEIKNKISINECTNEFYLSKTLKKINEEMEKNNNIKILNFHYDIMTSNTELSVVLQIVDDTNSLFQRRNNIFRKDGKYIGINVGKISDDLFCYYLLFGKDNN